MFEPGRTLYGVISEYNDVRTFDDNGEPFTETSAAIWASKANGGPFEVSVFSAVEITPYTWFEVMESQK